MRAGNDNCGSVGNEGGVFPRAKGEVGRESGQIVAASLPGAAADCNSGKGAVEAPFRSLCSFRLFLAFERRRQGGGGGVPWKEEGSFFFTLLSPTTLSFHTIDTAADRCKLAEHMRELI